MKREHDINWYLEDPTRFLLMKPFTRGGRYVRHGFEGTDGMGTMTSPTDLINPGYSNLERRPVSQDLYLTEYSPDLHHIILNQSIPHIRVMLNGTELPINPMNLTETASYQKLIHAAHVRSLTVNPLDFLLFDSENSEGQRKAFSNLKAEWEIRGREKDKYDAIKDCLKVGNVGVLFYFDKTANEYGVRTYSYEDGYQVNINYDEYGYEVARSLSYNLDGSIVIEAFDEKNHYRCIQKSVTDEKGNLVHNGWDIDDDIHGFSRCPLLVKRGLPAWEYAESTIEMWELMSNINAIALKRFGTFALVLTGDMDADSFKRDSSTLVINLSSDTTNGKQSADVLKFPEPETMDSYLDKLEEKISLFSSTSFITPKDITNTGSGGNGISLAMSNDFAVASQSAMDWRKFVQGMVALHQEGIDLEENGVNHYGNLKVGARIIPWFLETNNTKITNLTMENKWLSTQTIVEKSPDAAPDETERIIKERGALISREEYQKQKEADDAEKAARISKNNNNTIVTNTPGNNAAESE